MDTDLLEPDIEQLTRAAIKARRQTHRLREQELIAMSRSLYERHGEAVYSIGATDWFEKQRVRAHLKDLDLPAPELSPNPSVFEIQEHLDRVRAEIAKLDRADLEHEAVEIAKWAVEHDRTWRAHCREFILALARLVEMDARCTAVLDAAGASRANALPFTHIAGNMAEITFHGRLSLREAFDLAVSEDLVKASEIRGARSA